MTWLKGWALSLSFRRYWEHREHFPLYLEKTGKIAPSGEEPVRDIHLQLNHDIFFDVAEGRLFQSNPGGLSLSF
jgi:hypothetical protein